MIVNIGTFYKEISTACKQAKWHIEVITDKAKLLFFPVMKDSQVFISSLVTFLRLVLKRHYQKYHSPSF